MGGEVEDRRKKTTYEWPIANAHLPGYDPEQLMASHMSYHIIIGYGDILQELVSTCLHLGIPTRVRAGEKLDQEAPRKRRSLAE